MAFIAENLALAVDTIGGGNIRIHFYETDDPELTVTSENYVTNAARRGMRDGDVVIVRSGETTYLSYVDEIGAAGHGTLRVDKNLTIEYDSVAALEAATVPPIVNGARLMGYYAAGDKGGALYKRIAAPGDPGPNHIQSADGAWWELAESIVRPEMFGAVVGVVSGAQRLVNAQAFNDAFYSANVVVADGSRYEIDGTIAALSFRKLSGAGRDRTFLVSTNANLPLFRLPENLVGFSLRHVRLDRTVTATEGGDGIVCTAGTGICNLEYLEIYNQYRGMHLGSTDGAWVSHVLCVNNQSHGVSMTNIAAYRPVQWQLDDVYCTYNGGDGFHVQSSEGVEGDLGNGMILGLWNRVQTFANSGYGIQANGSETAQVNNLRVAQAIIGDDGLGGVRLNTYGDGNVFNELTIENAGRSSTGPGGATPATNQGHGFLATINNVSVRIGGCDIRRSSDAGVLNSCPKLRISNGTICNNGVYSGSTQKAGVIWDAGKVKLSNLEIGNQEGATTQVYGLIAGADTLQMIGCELQDNSSLPIYAVVPLNNSVILGCLPASIQSVHPNGIRGFTTGGIVVGIPTGGDLGAGTTNVANGAAKNGTYYTNP